MSIVATAAGGAVACCAALVWTYNRTLAHWRESKAKKLAALAVLPLGTVLGILGALAGPWFGAVAAAGGAITLWHLAGSLRASRDLRASKFTSRARFDAVNWPHLGPLARAVLRIAAPFNGIGDLRIHTREVVIPGLPREFDGYRVVHFTDTHVHPNLKEAWFRFVVREARRLSPDLCLFGGDFVSRAKHLPLAQAVLSGLTARDGVFFVRGNHDFWQGATPTRALGEMLGMKLLSNEAAVLRRGSAEIALVGIEAPYRRLRGEARRRIAAAPAARIALVHTPDAFATAAALGCQVALAGHTHGGQVRLPLFGTTLSGISAGPRYASGVARMGAMTTIASNGVGGFFPFRFRCPPEIVLLVLRAAD